MRLHLVQLHSLSTNLIKREREKDVCNSVGFAPIPIPDYTNDVDLFTF